MLMFIWELPQTLLGYIILFLFKKSIRKKIKYKDTVCYFIKNGFFSISLGRNLIIRDSAPEETLLHEYGHSIQSKYLGPLYLIIVGIPSVILNMYFSLGMVYLKWDKNKTKEYYNHFPENWADKLGKVKRV